MARGGYRKGAGAPGYGLGEKISKLKGTLLLAVLEDCEKHPERKLFWAEKFVNRLMPNEIAGTGSNRAIVLEIKDSKYAEIIRREASCNSKGSTK